MSTRTQRARQTSFARIVPAARQTDRGSVTAEFAIAVSAALVVCTLVLGAFQVVSLHVRATDAAGIAARLAARGDNDRAYSALAGLVPSGSLSISSSAELVCATVTAPVSIASLGSLGFEVSAHSCAATERDDHDESPEGSAE